MQGSQFAYDPVGTILLSVFLSLVYMLVGWIFVISIGRPRQISSLIALENMLGVLFLCAAVLQPGRFLLILLFSSMELGVLGPTFTTITVDLFTRLIAIADLRHETPGNRAYFCRFNQGDYWVHWKYSRTDWMRFTRLSRAEEKRERERTRIGLLFGEKVNIALRLLIYLVQFIIIVYAYLAGGLLWLLVITILFIIFLLIFYRGRLPFGAGLFPSRREVFIGPMGIWIPGIKAIFFNRPRDLGDPGEINDETDSRLQTNTATASFVQVRRQADMRDVSLVVRYTELYFGALNSPPKGREHVQAILVPKDQTRGLDTLLERMSAAYTPAASSETAPAEEQRLEDLTLALSQANGFEIQDLEANRAGRIGRDQKDRLIAEGGPNLTIWVLSASLVILAFNAIATAVDRSAFLATCRITDVVFLGVGLWLFGGRAADGLFPSVRSASGEVLRDRTWRRDHYYDHKYRMGKLEFGVGPAAYDALVPGHTYRIYYTRRARRFLSIEPVQQDPPAPHAS